MDQRRVMGSELPAGATIFTCENPVVVRAAELALGTSCHPLICTGGWPNAAVLTLLDGLHAGVV